ncbi:MAG: phosphoribosylaminoimidazole carboxylase [Candidatus Methanoperedens sp.]|nr:phosphoribosylaminoimidazole carboxylase [Candidatus Methanoperedens sp.]
MHKNNLYAIVFKSMELSDVLKKIKSNEISLEEAERQLRITNFELLSDIARVDVHRAKRTGIPEAIIADCKTCDEVASIARVLLKNEGRAIVTRVKDEDYKELKSLAKEFGAKIRLEKRAKIIVIGEPVGKNGGKVGVISAGTADIPVAEEAKVIAEEMGCSVTSIYDVGGEAALLSMLQSCSVLAVVNIDAGFVAGAFAARIASLASKNREKNGQG